MKCWGRLTEKTELPDDTHLLSREKILLAKYQEPFRMRVSWSISVPLPTDNQLLMQDKEQFLSETLQF